MKSKAILLWLLMLNGNAYAQFSGSELLNHCERQEVKTIEDVKDSVLYAGCMGYISGVTNTLFLLETREDFCVPDNVTRGQIAMIVVKWMKNHPEELHYPVPQQIYDSLVNTFPCESSK